MPPTISFASGPPPPTRAELAAHLGKQYEEVGVSIRGLAAAHAGSYGFIYSLLIESGATRRPAELRGGRRERDGITTAHRRVTVACANSLCHWNHRCTWPPPTARWGAHNGRCGTWSVPCLGTAGVNAMSTSSQPGNRNTRYTVEPTGRSQ